MFRHACNFSVSHHYWFMVVEEISACTFFVNHCNWKWIGGKSYAFPRSQFIYRAHDTVSLQRWMGLYRHNNEAPLYSENKNKRKTWVYHEKIQACTAKGVFQHVEILLQAPSNNLAITAANIFQFIEKACQEIQALLINTEKEYLKHYFKCFQAGRHQLKSHALNFFECI